MKKLFFISALIAFCNSVVAQSLQPFRSATGKWGYKDDNGKIIVPAKYEFGTKPFSEGMGVVYNSGLRGYGVVDAMGKEVVAPQYTTIYDYKNGLAKVCANGTNIYGTNGKWGFIDKKGNVIIPIEYDRIDGIFEGESYVSATKDKRTQIIDRNGKVISFPGFELLGTFFKSKLALARKGELYGMVDKAGNTVIPFEYTRLYGESEGLIAAEKNGKFGFIDTKNKWVVAPAYKSGSFFEKGYVTLEKDGKSGTIDKTGKIIVPFKYDYMYPSLSNAVLIAQMGEKKGLISPITGKELTPIKYDDIRDFNDGIAVVSINSKYGLINESGKEIVPVKYEYASSLIDGFVYVQDNGKYGFLDRSGKIVIPLKYNYVSEFQGGIASVTEGTDRYYINKKGERVTE